MIAAPDPASRMVAFAWNGRVAPVAVLTAPSPYAAWPFRVVKRPPTTRDPPPGATTMASTWPFADGAHDRGLPVAGSNAARRDRPRPAATVKAPPTKTRDAVTAT